MYSSPTHGKEGQVASLLNEFVETAQLSKNV